TSAPLAPSAARSRHAAHRDLPSFPTRRSSDLRELTLAELDDAAGGRPAFIQAQYDHAAVNTGWLDATGVPPGASARAAGRVGGRSEEHTSELQSLTRPVCRLLLEKKQATTRRH